MEKTSVGKICREDTMCCSLELPVGETEMLKLILSLAQTILKKKLLQLICNGIFSISGRYNGVITIFGNFNF